MQKPTTILSKILLLLNVLCTIVGQAQPKYFEQSYIWGENINAMGLSLIEKPNGNYVIIGPVADPTYQWHTFMMEITLNGFFANVHEYGDNEFYIVQKDIVESNDGYLMSGFIDNVIVGSTSIIRVEENGDYIDSSTIGPTNYINHSNTLCRLNSGDFFLGGEIQPYDSTVSLPPTHPYLAKLDSIGQKLWDTTYYQFGPPYYSWFMDSKATPDGGAILVGVDRATMYIGDALLLKVDSGGNIQQQAIFDYDELEYGTKAIPTSDGGYLLIGGWGVYSDIIDNQGGLVIRLNSNMGEIWHNKDYFYNFVAAGVSEIIGEGYVISGNYVDTNSSTDEINPEIIKLNYDGQLLWKRHYGLFNSRNEYVYDMIATSDGGYIMCGRFDTIGIAKIYVLKTNCMGLLTEPQAEFDTQTEADYTVSFFNQSMYTYPDSIDGGHYRWDFGDGSPPYTCGQGYAPCPAVVQHTYAQAGTYTAQLTAIVCSDTAQVTQTVAASAVGMPASVGQEGGIKVYPNPASESLSLRYNGTQTAQWVLYDMSGRLLKSRDLNGQDRSTQIISVSDLPVGLYYYILHSPNDPSTNQYGKLSIVR